MSYDISLLDPVTKQVIVFDKIHFLKGGTYCCGGTDRAWLNITYNYSGYYYFLMGDQGIRSLYGLTGAESIPLLQAAIDQLKDDVDVDYWKATEGNSKRPLLQLLAMAQMRPDGIWSGD